MIWLLSYPCSQHLHMCALNLSNHLLSQNQFELLSGVLVILPVFIVVSDSILFLLGAYFYLASKLHDVINVFIPKFRLILRVTIFLFNLVTLMINRSMMLSHFIIFPFSVMAYTTFFLLDYRNILSPTFNLNYYVK